MKLLSSLVLAPLALAPLPLGAQAAARPCSGLAPDSAWLASGPVFRDCEVDRPAKRRGSDPVLSTRHFQEMPTAFTCQALVIEFVVEPDGSVDTTTARLISSDHHALTMAVREILPKLRFEAARQGKEPVRQLFVYRRGVARGDGRVAFRVGRINPGGVSVPAPSLPVSSARSLQACEK